MGACQDWCLAFFAGEWTIGACQGGRLGFDGCCCAEYPAWYPVLYPKSYPPVGYHGCVLFVSVGFVDLPDDGGYDADGYDDREDGGYDSSCHGANEGVGFDVPASVEVGVKDGTKRLGSAVD